MVAYMWLHILTKKIDGNQLRNPPKLLKSALNICLLAY